MIKVSFQYDSSDPQASAFFNWISAFPLETTSIRLNTSIDLIESDQKGNDQNIHHIGNIVLESRKDDVDHKSKRGSGNKGIFGSGWLSGIGKRKPVTPETLLDIDSPVAGNDPDPVVKEQISAEPVPFKPEVSPSVDSGDGGAFDSDMDDFLLNDVLFSDGDMPLEVADDSAELVPESTENTLAVSFSTEEDLGLSEDSEGADPDTLDFLLGALDEFNQE